jgi:uncharacterized oligopeptide transporter (OPT) family protein
MSVESWTIFWKIVFIIGVGMFAILSFFVIIGGAKDVAKLIQRLKKDAAESQTSETISDEE